MIGIAMSCSAAAAFAASFFFHPAAHIACAAKSRHWKSS